MPSCSYEIQGCGGRRRARGTALKTDGAGGRRGHVLGDGAGGGVRVQGTGGGIPAYARGRVTLNSSSCMRLTDL